MNNTADIQFYDFPSDDDFLHIFLPIIDDEKQRRLEELEEEDDDWISSVFEETDEVIAK